MSDDVVMTRSYLIENRRKSVTLTVSEVHTLFPTWKKVFEAKALSSLISLQLSNPATSIHASNAIDGYLKTKARGGVE